VEAFQFPMARSPDDDILPHRQWFSGHGARCDEWREVWRVAPVDVELAVAVVRKVVAYERRHTKGGWCCPQQVEEYLQSEMASGMGVATALLMRGHIFTPREMAVARDTVCWRMEGRIMLEVHSRWWVAALSAMRELNTEEREMVVKKIMEGA
jgi:hypothetical protein